MAIINVFSSEKKIVWEESDFTIYPLILSIDHHQDTKQQHNFLSEYY